eukprot:scaffold5956_cov385-Prasinococcus_capsulatus_cf.AAC.5
MRVQSLSGTTRHCLWMLFKYLLCATMASSTDGDVSSWLTSSSQASLSTLCGSDGSRTLAHTFIRTSFPEAPLGR